MVQAEPIRTGIACLSGYLNDFIWLDLFPFQSGKRRGKWNYWLEVGLEKSSACEVMKNKFFIRL